MTLRRARIILLAALALLIPLRASAGDATGALSVSASLGGCGVASGGVVCQIDTSFNPVAGAEYYTATVTLADASVRSFGTVGAGGASFYVPYVGSGVYRVEVTAWGYDEEGEPEEIDIDTGKTTGDGAPVPDGNDQEPAPGEEDESVAPEESGGGEATEDPAPTDPVAPTEPTTPSPPTEPDCSPTNPDGSPRTVDPAVCPQVAPQSAPASEPASEPAPEAAPDG